MELGFLNIANKPIFEDHKYDSTPSQDVDSGEMGSVDNNMEKKSGMDISDDYKPE